MISFFALVFGTIGFLGTAQTIKSEFKCKLCLFVGNTAQEYLRNYTSQGQLKCALMLVCDSLSEEYQPMCTKFVDSYLMIVLQAMLPQINVRQICDEVHFCDVKLFSDTTKEEISSEFCEEVIVIFKAELQSPEFRKSLVNLISYFCQNIFGRDLTTCLEDSKEMVEWLRHSSDKIDPASVCNYFQNRPQGKALKVARLYH
ncbi:hypothetical protein HZS_6920 [Henneguya salminicola]|nr:hypothetical protein HZS_6920 [Henneguya salminicola]